jgi:signal transduction histidine kinase
MMRPRIGLRAKLLGVTVGLVAFLTLGAVGIVQHDIGRQIRQQTARTLHIGTEALTVLLERTQGQLLEHGSILASLPSLRAGLTTSPTQLEPLLQRVTAARAANLLWATNALGVVVASTAEHPPPGTALVGHPLIEAALAGKTSSGFDVVQDEWWLLVCLPVTADDSSELIGTVTLGVVIGEAYVNRLAELVGAEVGFLWEARQVWSRGWPQAARWPLAEEAAGASPGVLQEQAGAAERYFWMPVEITVGLYPRLTRLRAVLGTVLDEAVVRRTSQAIWWIALCGLLLGFLLLRKAILSVTQPLKDLVADSRRVGEGQLAHRTQVQGADEVGELAASFNRMVENLERSRAELMAATRRLEELVAVKDEMITKVSHELRTPLTSIIEGVRLMLDNVLGDTTTDQQEMLRIADAGLRRLTELINNLVNMSEVQTGRLRLRRRRVDLGQVLQTAAEDCKLLLGARTLRVHAPGAAPVFADPDRLLRVFSNLLSNAIKYTEEAGVITVQVEPRNGHVATTIRDDGRGIAPEDLSRLFQKFSQVGPRDPAQPHGTGLGLALCKDLVELHQGRIEVASEWGRGTTFTVLLPPYQDAVALAESFNELRQGTAFDVGQTIGLITLGPAAGFSPDASTEERRQQLAQAVRRNVKRSDDVLEIEPHWVVVFIVADRSGIQAVVDRLRRVLLREPSGLHIGVAVYPDHGPDATSLFAVATSAPAPRSAG